jgi:hypothetical protein
MHWLLHVLDLAWNILYETTSNALFDSLADEEFRVSVFVDLLEIQTIVKHHIARLSEPILEAIIISDM